jgi:hypothetical protein
MYRKTDIANPLHSYDEKGYCRREEGSFHLQVNFCQRRIAIEMLGCENEKKL